MAIGFWFFYHRGIYPSRFHNHSTISDFKFATYCRSAAQALFKLPQVGPKLAHVDIKLAQAGTKLAEAGAKLAPSWSKLASSCPQVDPSWSQVGSGCP